MDPSLPVYAMRSFEDQIDTILSTERLLSFLASIFGIVATLLVVSRRLREIGIRIALGTKTSSVITLVMKEILLLIAGGIAVGIPAAILLSEYVQSQLYGMVALLAALQPAMTHLVGSKSGCP